MRNQKEGHPLISKLGIGKTANLDPVRTYVTNVSDYKSEMKTTHMYFIIFILHLVSADFAVIGDWGGHGGQQHQRRIAGAIASRNPKFVISAGDNFYPNGITHSNDPKVDQLWTNVYENEKRPWLAVLGNHDYLGNASAQIAINNTNWIMPSRYYSITYDDTTFWFLDTTPWMPFNYVEVHHKRRGGVSDESRADFAKQRSLVPEQIEWLRRSMAKSTSRQKYIVGHHPLWTYGYHRFANHTPLIDVILDLHETHHLAAYLCGHDHSLQHIHRSGLHQFLAGAGSSSYRVYDGPGLQYKTTTSDHGFLMIYDNGTASFIDEYNRVLYRSGKFV